jgi:eukaryotic-like serine/threonine-protein kinase
MSLTAGTRFGAYEILGPLGEGGMGEVYRARDTELEREVAIKVLPATFASDDNRVARFEQEARTLAALNHPNIAQVYGLARSQEGQTAIAMELVEGPTLADRIALGALPADEALNIAMQIADALEAAHDKGLIHRDLKPANVKVRPDGTVKVLDFGIAKALDTRVTTASGAPALTTPAMTEAGIVLGTAAYMSPEQARGRPVDQRADIWAFGVLLYEMLTGQPAFAGEDVTITLARVLERDTNLDALPKAVTPAVRHTIRLCLQKDVRKRIHHIGDVRLGLEGALETKARPSQQEAEPAPVPPRRIGVIALTAVAAALVTSAAAFALWPRPEPAAVSRFDQRLPPGFDSRRDGRSTVDVAPDGSAIVYNTGSGLLLRRIDDVEPRVIPGTEPDLTNPFFSADSTEVAYWVPSDELYRVAVDGGTPPVMITGGITNPYGASWSDDDTILVGQQQQIVRVSADGGTPEPVIEVGKDEVVYGPRLLPGGEWVLFGISSVDDLLDGRIVVESLTTHERKVLVEHGNDARFLPTGHLVYARGDVLIGVLFNLDTLSVTGSGRPLVPGVARANANQTGVAQYGVADNGLLAYRNGSSLFSATDNRLVWVGADGREEALPVPPGGYVYPRISPNGARIVLDDNIGDDGFQIWDFAGGTLTTLTLTGRATGFPIWTPDSSTIVYGAGSGSWGIESKAANDTGPIEKLASSPVNDLRIPSFFTPSGTGIVFSSEENNGTADDLGLLRLDGDGEVDWLVREASSEINVELSPNGRWMAYQSNVSGSDEIYVRPFPDTDRDRVQISNAGGDMPLWSPDGKEIFYLEASNVGTNDRLMAAAVSVTGDTLAVTGRRAVIDPWLYLGTFAVTARPYDVSADGQRFLAIKNAAVAATGSEITVVLNWFEELKRLVPVP